MNKLSTSISNRLSLRRPQADSLDILTILADKLSLQKNAEIAVELQKVKELYPTCTDFERNFPSICFSLATGVGKTRLMGAFITYLYLAKGIKHYFVLAPNLTIYNKLIEDFSNPTNQKYVFKGIGEFVSTRPRIITGENYNETMFEAEISVNIFNISKINAETRADQKPRIKRLSEYLGESYFNYLSRIEDLVLLMDESHHYRADRGMEVINELNPILGLELTATPQVERGGNAIKFKNVVYEYSLAKAIRDGFVKEPAVATRKDFDPSQYSTNDLDRIKIEDGIRLHEDTRVALEQHSRDNKVKRVKPFVLVVAKDTDHAARLKELIVSPAFFGGYYSDKVMEIHSNQRGEEKEENIAQLLTLEEDGNRIEIVIHVNMLKEGWDITNLYTIVPLRTATAKTLREQTIGRGLRLPYGIRTGNDKVDKLTIVAHDKFQEIVDEANKPDSIVRQENIIVIDPQELENGKVIVAAVSTIEHQLEQKRQTAENIDKPEEQKKALLRVDVEKNILETIPELNTSVRNVGELKSEEVKSIALRLIKERIENNPAQVIFKDLYLEEAERHYEGVIDTYINNVIEIPQIILRQSGEVRTGFHEFDLDVSSLTYQPVSEEILRRSLSNNTTDVVTGAGRVAFDVQNILIEELCGYPEVNYDSQSVLLVKLITQAIEKLRSYLTEEQVSNVIQYHRKVLGECIYTQLMSHFYLEEPPYAEPEVRPFSNIEQHNLTRYTEDAIYTYTETITPTSDIPQKVFTGFRKACHTLYKFNSKTEKDFAAILEQDKCVLKWLRPAQNQFDIWWQHNSRRYQPDFVVETGDAIYLVETKKEKDVETAEVQEKAKAAITYCQHATRFTAANNGKPWKYILIPHDAVKANMGFAMLSKQYEKGA